MAPKLQAIRGMNDLLADQLPYWQRVEAAARELFADYGYREMRVPVVEFDGIDVDQVPLTEALRVVEDGLNRAMVSHGVPIAPLEVIVIMKLLAGRTQDLADVEAIVDSGADREQLKVAVQKAVPGCADTLERLFANVDRAR